MLDFSKINKPNLFYSIIYRYVSYVHNLIYYRKFKVLHKDRIPKNEGSLVICNHQNGLNDALALLLMGAKSRMVFIARGDIFKKDSIGKLLRFLRILPAFRKRDVGTEGLKDNDLIFEESARIIQEGDNVVIFPEATHQHGHYLNVFKKGFARIAFKTAEETDFQKDVKILPVGIHYDSYFHIESRLLVNIGEPFTFDDLYETFKEHPERAQRLLADRSRAAVQELMLDIDDPDHYDAIYMLCKIYRHKWIKNSKKLPTFENEFIADRSINKVMQDLKASDVSAYESLMAKADEYRNNIESLKLKDWIFEKKVFVWSWLRGLLWLLYSPLVLAIFLINFLPYKASNLITSKMADKQLHASIHIGLGIIVIVPLWSILLLVVIGLLTHSFWIGLVSALVWPFTLKLYYHLKVDFLKLYNRFRRTRFILTKNPLFRKSCDLRSDIVDELDKLFKVAGK